MPRTICYLENGASSGGSFESVTLLASHLDRTRYTPFVVFVNATPVAETLRAVGVRTIVLRDPLYSVARAGVAQRIAGYTRAAAHRSHIAVAAVERAIHRPTLRALSAAMRAAGADLLHCNNNPIRDYYGIAAASALGIPCVSHIRSLRIGDASRRAAPALLAGVTQFVANSHYTARWWAAEVGIPLARIAVVSNAVAVDVPDPADLQPWIGNRGTPVIGCVANFTAGKGHEFLCDAFAIVRRTCPHATLLLVGDGPRRPLVERYVRTCGLGASVVFTGYTGHARAIIRACDVLVVPSATEAFGRTVLEAMVAGTPVVATRVGGIPELVDDGVNGCLVVYDDAPDAAHAILRCIHDTAFTRQCTAAGRRTAAQYDVASHVRAITKIYDAVFVPRTMHVLA